MVNICTDEMMYYLCRELDEYIRLQETITVTVDGLESTIICHGDVIRLNPDQRSVLLMCLINNQISTTSTGLIEQPEIGELGKEWTRNIKPMGLGQIGNNVIEQ